MRPHACFSGPGSVRVLASLVQRLHFLFLLSLSPKPIQFDAGSNRRACPDNPRSVPNPTKYCPGSFSIAMLGVSVSSLKGTFKRCSLYLTWKAVSRACKFSTPAVRHAACCTYRPTAPHILHSLYQPEIQLGEPSAACER